MSPYHPVTEAAFAEPGEMDREDPMPSFAKLKPGMTPEQVHRIVGAPKHIARQILYHRYREQWTYDAPTPVRLTFDCPRGELPRLLSAPRPSRGSGAGAANRCE